MSQNLANNYSQNNTHTSNVYNVVDSLQDYMFTRSNLEQYTKDMYIFSKNQKPNKTLGEYKKEHTLTKMTPKQINNIYKPLKKDSLFWCFFILKYGFTKYEMDIGSQQFTIEKTEKFANIELLRTKENKDLLKIHKIKPLSDLEDDLSNSERITIKTFFALCIVHKINILLVDGQKIYQSINNDEPLINVVHRNSKSYEHYIELNVSNDTINNFRENYYNVSGFDSGLKSISSYKVEELHNLCKKLNITNALESLSNTKSKKLTKKDIYELIVQNF